MNVRAFVWAVILTIPVGIIVTFVLGDIITREWIGLAVSLALISLHIALIGVGEMIITFLNDRLPNP